MPLASHTAQSAGGFDQPVAQTGSMQIVAPELPVPTPLVIADGATWNSGIVFANGFRQLSVGVLSDHAGTLNIQRYIDLKGVVKQGAVSATAIVAGTLLVVNITDKLPFVTYYVEIVNSAGAVANLTKFGILMDAE